VTALAFEGVTYRYPACDEPALRDVSFTVCPGEFVVLAGGSAAGKSTLLRTAGGLVPHLHGGRMEGSVVIGGLDARDHGPGAIAAVAGSLFQDPETQVVLGTVRAELAFPLENRAHAPAAVARGVEEVALALGIGDLLDRPTHQLSGGELQRVALGAALAGRPDIVLLDEPTSQLDPVAGDELIWLLRRLNEEWGTTVLLSEHRLERCLPAADRVLALQGGELAWDGPPEGFLRWAEAAAPALQTPAGRLGSLLGLDPLPVGVKAARTALTRRGLLPLPTVEEPAAPAPPSRRARRAAGRDAALALGGVWAERPGGRTVLRGVDLAFAPGERVALMGRNGAGKSTLLRHAAGIDTPTRGRVRAGGRVGLLLQTPGDYLLHDRVDAEARPEALEAMGLGELADRHPADLSGGQRQRLALAVVLDADEPPAALLLDEPTRGMDRALRGALAERLRRLSEAGTAVVVATHDPEFAVSVADRVVLLAEGRVIADAPTEAVLGGGWYFATETARILGGAYGALVPEAAEALLRREGALVP
jgi:energy-coupling factor transport system ATP-binding protein